MGKLRPDSRLKVRSGGFSSFFPAFSSSSVPSGSGTFPTSNPPKIPWKSPSSLWHRYSQNSWENSGNSLWITFPSPCKVVSYTKIHKSQQLLCSSWDLVWFSKVFFPFFCVFRDGRSCFEVDLFFFFLVFLFPVFLTFSSRNEGSCPSPFPCGWMDGKRVGKNWEKSGGIGHSQKSPGRV